MPYSSPAEVIILFFSTPPDGVLSSGNPFPAMSPIDLHSAESLLRFGLFWRLTPPLVPAINQPSRYLNGRALTANYIAPHGSRSSLKPI